MDSANASTIGLFDSGVGGLSILRRLEQMSNNYGLDLRFVYFADTLRCPYGDRSPAEIISYVDEIVSWFNTSKVDKLVMACNTSAALARHIAVKQSQAPVFDLISPAAQYAAGNFKRIGVLATSATCRTRAFSRAIKDLNPHAYVLELACPDLVPLVEQGVFDGPAVKETIEKYVFELKEHEIDSLIFGCTHFPFLEEAFRRELPDLVSFIDPAKHLSEELFAGAAIEPLIIGPQSSFVKHSFYCSGDKRSFSSAAELCLGLSQGQLNVQQLSLDQLKGVNALSPAGSLLNNPLNLASQ